MLNIEKVREQIINLFTDEILLTFWTHEHCPPNKGIETCPKDTSGKHERCMSCWKEWVAAFADQILAVIKKAYPVRYKKERE